jgi:hypothetical protein
VAARPVDAVTTGCAAGDSVLVPRTAPPTGRPPRVVAALRSLPDDAVVLIDALDAARHLGGTLAVLHGVPVSFGERSVGREEALGRGRDLLEQARGLLGDTEPRCRSRSRCYGHGRTRSSASSSTPTCWFSAVPGRGQRVGSVSLPARPFGTPRAPCCWRHGLPSGCRHQDSS